MDGSVNSYRTTEVLGSSQLDLILKVYDGAIGAFRKAETCIDANDQTGATENLEAARRFLVHLYTTLDLEKGGDVALSLGKMYTYLICQVDVVQATKDKSLIESNIRVLDNLRTGWSGLKENQPLETTEPSEPVPVGAGGGFTVSG